MVRRLHNSVERRRKTKNSTRGKSIFTEPQNINIFVNDRCRLLSCAGSGSPSQSLCADPTSLWHNLDIWTSIMNFLNGKDLIRLAVTNHYFYRLVMEECVWKDLCGRELGAFEANNYQFSWKCLYKSAVDGSHSYKFHSCDKHLDWMRIGCFRMESREALATEKLWELADKVRDEKLGLKQELLIADNTSSPFCNLSNIKQGAWIADLHLVRCPVCNLSTCEGTMQAFDARHWELFLCKEYRNGEWSFEEVCGHVVRSHCRAATAGIFDVGHLTTTSTIEMLNLKSWIATLGDWQPRVKGSLHAVASSTNLQPNEGVQIKFYAMKAGKDGPVVAIRISQQLI